jgi:sulfatase maturation enzyme AslB (radical SAM superfamily)
MLVITQRCNLRCRYCYENYGDGAEMSLEEAVEILDKELSNVEDKEVKLFLFGGEPFLGFELIRDIYGYLHSNYPEFHILYSVTTNGTLIHNKIQNWLEERKDEFEIVLSVDGNRQMHDSNRRCEDGEGSFEQIDLAFFQKNWPGCTAKMTISNLTLKNFADGIIYLEDRGFYCKANFASGLDYRLDAAKKLLWENMRRLIDRYTLCSEQKLCYMLDLKLASILLPIDDAFRYCGAGKGRRCYIASDKWYPCQGLSEMSIGSEKFKYEEFEDDTVRRKSPCGKCEFIRICKKCYAMNYMDTGNVWEAGGQTCYLNKVCMLVSARIQYNRILQKRKTRYSAQDKLTLKAIYKIATVLGSELNMV